MFTWTERVDVMVSIGEVAGEATGVHLLRRGHSRAQREAPTANILLFHLLRWVRLLTDMRDNGTSHTKEKSAVRDKSTGLAYSTKKPLSTTHCHLIHIVNK